MTTLAIAITIAFAAGYFAHRWLANLAARDDDAAVYDPEQAEKQR